MRNLMTSISALLLLSGFMLGQEDWVFNKEYEFGDVSDQELEMTAEAIKPGLDATILNKSCDLMIVLDGSNFKREADIHYRYKIFYRSRQGSGRYVYRFTIPVLRKFFDLEVRNYLPNGEVIKMDIGKEVKEERENNRTYKKFAVPGIEVGSIIDLKYRRLSDYVYILQPWYFQENYHVASSSIQVTLPSGFLYRTIFLNTEDLEAKVERKIFARGSREQMDRFTWTMKDIPELKREPVMRSMEDYYAGMQFQLVKYRTYDIAKDWNAIAKDMVDVYQDYLDADEGLSELVSKLTSGITDKTEIAKVLYQHVRDNFETINQRSIYTNSELKEVLEKEKKGGRQKKNLILVNMLRRAGIDANPVLISRRNHGRVIPNFESLIQFNQTLVHYPISKTKSKILDTSDPYCPFGLLPYQSITEQGLLIRDDSQGIIPLPKQKGINIRQCKTDLVLSADGSLKGNSSITYKGYRAIYARKENCRSRGS